ncbi:MAG TPA: alpha/beta hydrolase-fold protein [Gaiellaceae bacterium]|nr:alpha/beta hydrolase-fold protein [Gaiellaceae bacterium]
MEVSENAVEFVLPDADSRIDQVVLAQEVERPRLGPPFERQNGAWHLSFARPPANRLEYLLQVDGSLTQDHDNPLRAPGPFGDKSVVLWPEYVPPAWLGVDAPAGTVEPLELASVSLRASFPALLYATATPPSAGAPILVVHDGPEYAEYSLLTRYLDVASHAGLVPPLWVALVPPVDRNETYSASPRYARALANELLPALAKAVPHGPRLGMGASLGALAMLHAHRLHPESFDGLFLQSGSFFRQRWDAVESGFERYRRITRFVGTVLRCVGEPRPVPVAITCGSAEENRVNNRAVASVLSAQGYQVMLAEIADAHNWVCWRDGFDPNLPDLVRAVAG